MANKNNKQKKKTSYIIGPIGDEGTGTRDWADFIRDYVIEPAVTQCGYEKPGRAERDFQHEIIPIKIIKAITEAQLVIADLTNTNPNVFYELGIRHCTRKPIIHIIKYDQKPPFDLSVNTAIFVGIHPERVKQSIQEIKDRIEAIQKNPNQFYSHIQTMDIFKWYAPSISDQPATKYDQYLLLMCTELTAAISKLQQEVSYLKRPLPPGLARIPSTGSLRPTSFITEGIDGIGKGWQEEVWPRTDGNERGSPEAMVPPT